MRRRWLKLGVLAALAFYVSGAMQFIHLCHDHLPSHHSHAHEGSSPNCPAPDAPDSHSGCSLCQDMAMVRAITLEPPAVEEKLQITGEAAGNENPVSLFSASYIIPFPRPPPFSSL